MATFKSFPVSLTLVTLTSSFCCIHSPLSLPPPMDASCFSCFLCMRLFCWKLNTVDNFIASLGTGLHPPPIVTICLFICLVTAGIVLMKSYHLYPPTQCSASNVPPQGVIASGVATVVLGKSGTGGLFPNLRIPPS